MLEESNTTTLRRLDSITGFECQDGELVESLGEWMVLCVNGVFESVTYTLWLQQVC